jgi:chaperone modulatory protein CbpM
METEYMIDIREFCSIHDIEVSFVISLNQSGLIELKKVNDAEFIEAAQLQQLEKFVNLYYELDINLEGIETVNYLLERIGSMQEEIKVLNNKLRLYESG